MSKWSIDELFAAIHPSTYIFSLLEKSGYSVAQLQQKTVENGYKEKITLWHGPTPLTEGFGSIYEFAFKPDNGYFMCFETGQRGDLFNLTDALHMNEELFNHVGEFVVGEKLYTENDFLFNILQDMHAKGLRDSQELIEHDIIRDICGTSISGNYEEGYTKDAVNRVNGTFQPTIKKLNKFDL